MAGPKSSTQEVDVSSRMSVDRAEAGDNESIPVANPPGIPHPTLGSDNTTLTPLDLKNDVEHELQEVAGVINKARRVIVFVGAGISTNCGIPVSIHLHN